MRREGGGRGRRRAYGGSGESCSPAAASGSPTAGAACTAAPQADLMGPGPVAAGHQDAPGVAIGRGCRPRAVRRAVVEAAAGRGTTSVPAFLSRLFPAQVNSIGGTPPAPPATRGWIVAGKGVPGGDAGTPLSPALALALWTSLPGLYRARLTPGARSSRSGTSRRAQPEPPAGATAPPPSRPARPAPRGPSPPPWRPVGPAGAQSLGATLTAVAPTTPRLR